MNGPLVTIGIPAFKGRYFREALNCWKAQTYGNFEVFVQDDRSPDDLESAFREVCTGDARFHFERNGRSTAPDFVDNWTKTLDKANGEYFVLGSDDDLYEPEFLERMVALGSRHPGIDVFDARHDFFDGNGCVTSAPETKEVESRIEWLHAVVCERRNAIAQSVMCRTSALRSAGGFVGLPAAWGGCDWLSWARLAGKGIANSSEVLMHWRTNGGNTTSSVDPYWVRQKLAAVDRARGLWRELVEDLRPADEASAVLVADIRRRAVDGFFRWMKMCVVDDLPKAEYRREIMSAFRNGDLTFLQWLRFYMRRLAK